MIRRETLPIVTLTLLLCFTLHVAAHECQPQNPTCEPFWKADTVFLGRVVSVSPVSASPSGVSRRKVRFAVERAYREKKRTQVDVITETSYAEEADNFKKGQRYLVYAERRYSSKDKNFETLIIDECIATKLAEKAEQEIGYIESLPKTVRGVGVLGAKAISRPQPTYPIVAKLSGISGLVSVRLNVDESGRVTDAQVLCGHHLLVEAARKAAIQSRFSPVLVSGKAAKFVTTVQYNFALE